MMRIKLLKACLLLGALHFTFTETNAAMPEPAEVVERRCLFEQASAENSLPVPGYLKHQFETVQERAVLRGKFERHKAQLERTDGSDYATQRAEIEKRLKALNEILPKTREKQASLSNAEIDRHKALAQEKLTGVLERIEKASKEPNIQVRGRVIAELEAQRQQYETNLKHLQNSDEIVKEIAALEVELETLSSKETHGARAALWHLTTLAALKIKTLYNLPTLNRRALEADVHYKYSRDYDFGQGVEQLEQGTIISLFNDFPRLMHKMGIGRDLVSGVTPSESDPVGLTTDSAAPDDDLAIQYVFVNLLTALETPSLHFKASDLPMPHKVRKGSGGYEFSEQRPENYLKALAFMAEHIAGTFDTRLREDIGALKIIASEVNPEERYLGEDEPSSKAKALLTRTGVLTEAVFDPLWSKGDERGQSTFVDIVKGYDPDFNLSERPVVLNAAIPGNSLGMVYRLIEAAEAGAELGFCSWNSPDGVSLMDQIEEMKTVLRGLRSSDDPETATTEPVIYPKLLEVVHRIVGRHFNKIVLEKMADHLKVLAAQPVGSSFVMTGNLGAGMAAGGSPVVGSGGGIASGLSSPGAASGIGGAAVGSGASVGSSGRGSPVSVTAPLGGAEANSPRSEAPAAACEGVSGEGSEGGVAAPTTTPTHAEAGDTTPPAGEEGPHYTTVQNGRVFNVYANGELVASRVSKEIAQDYLSRNAQ